jgi:hypothetical protein
MLPEVTNIEPELFLSWGKSEIRDSTFNHPLARQRAAGLLECPFALLGPPGSINAACVYGHPRALLDAIDRLRANRKRFNFLFADRSRTISQATRLL